MDKNPGTNIPQNALDSLPQNAVDFLNFLLAKENEHRSTIQEALGL